MKKIFRELMASALVFLLIFGGALSISVYGTAAVVRNEVATITQGTNPVEFSNATFYDYGDKITSTDYGSSIASLRADMLKSYNKVCIEDRTGIDGDTKAYKVDQSVAEGSTETEKVRSLDGAYVLYKNESFDLTGFAVWMYQTEYDENLLCNVYISEDGETFSSLSRKYGEYEITVNYITSENVYEIVFYSDYLKEGTKYLKVEFSKNCSTLEDVAKTQIGMAAVDCADINELPHSDIEFVNNVYTDNCNSVTDSTYAKYTNMRTESGSTLTRRGKTTWIGRQSSSVSESYITYTCPDSSGEITDVTVWMGRFESENVDITVSISSDGSLFKEVGTIQMKNIPVYPAIFSPTDSTGNWICSMGSLAYLPHGAKYMRLTMPETTYHWWGINLLEVKFGYDSATLKKPTTQIVTYDAPQGPEMSTAYTAKVRALGDDEWKNLDIYATQLRGEGDTGKAFLEGDSSSSRASSLTYFDFEGAVEVAVTKTAGTIGNFSILPKAHGIECRKDGNTAYFTLTEPKKLIVKADEDDYDVLHLFANPLEEDVPDLTADNVIYFAPGYYNYANTGGILTAKDTDTDYPYGELRPPSNSIVYIAGGAVVDTHIIISDKENVTICGRGILSEKYMNTGDGQHRYGTWSHWGMLISRSQNVTVKDVIFNNAEYYSISGGQSKGITIDNFKAISNMEWADGIDMMGCSDVTINDCFLRNADDCIAIYADRQGYVGNAENWTITNNVLVADVSRAINIGGHGSQNAEDKRTIQNIYCENNHSVINRVRSTWREYAGTFSVNAGDENIVKNVTFKNSTIENADKDSLFSVRVKSNAAYGGIPGYSAENILFENIYSDGEGYNAVEIHGWNVDGDRMVSDVIIKNLYISGELQRTFEGANIEFSSSDYPDYYKEPKDVYLIAVGDGARNVSVTYDVKNPVNNSPMVMAAEYDDKMLSNVKLVDFENIDGIYAGTIKDMQKPFDLYTFDRLSLRPLSHKQRIGY